MRRVKKNNSSKRAITLVELVVAMALTAIFAAACVVIMYPVITIYTHVNDLTRTQLLADSVVDVLRAECAKTYIKDANSVVIQSSTSEYGNSICIRRTANYIETIGSNYAITPAEWTAVYEQNLVALSEAGSTDLPDVGPDGFSSRSIYRMFTGSSAGNPPTVGAPAPDASVGYLHFGYLVSETTSYDANTPRYDYTNPFPSSTYNFSRNANFRIRLNFHWEENHDTSAVPSYILCDVSVLRQTGTTNAGEPICDPNPVYTRENVVLCFASPVV